MAVIKVFDSVGVKTVQLMGNLVGDQPYDSLEEIDSASDDTEAED